MPLILYEEDECQKTGQQAKQRCFYYSKEKQNNIPAIHLPGGAIDLLCDNLLHSNRRPGIQWQMQALLMDDNCPFQTLKKYLEGL